MKKILVLGSGMAGHIIAIYLKEKGYEVTVFSMRSFLYCFNIVGNAFDTDVFKGVLIAENYDAVINCIGVLNQSADQNQSRAVYLNSYLPHLISDTLKDTNTKLIHMSTDCVFAGNTGPYYENSFRDGSTFYDRSKALGEVEDAKNLTYRNSIVGPDMNPAGIGLFNWFMKQSGTVDGYTRAIWTGVTTLTLAKAMERAIEENLCGLYNLVNNTCITKYDLLVLFNTHFRNGELIINENNTLILDKSLMRTRDDFSFEIPSYENMVIEMKDWVYNHKYLYPNYFNS